MIVDELKKAILDYAIKGKLSSQNFESEKTDELLLTLNNARNMMEYKPSKDKINISAMDFEIPSNWSWGKLNELFNFIDYRGKTPNKLKMGIPLITATNIKKGFLDFSKKFFISEDEFKDRKSRGITKIGDILFTTEAPMGHSCINDVETCSTGQRIITFQNYDKVELNNTLFNYFILSPVFQKQLDDNCTGTTAKGIKSSKLKGFIIPVPPIKEQQRIVDKIEQLFSKLNELNDIEIQLHNLQNNFPSELKKALLQSAIQGKLTKSKKTDSKIKCDKMAIKFEKSSSGFEIPQQWEWHYISDVTFFQEGPGILATDFRTNGIPLIRISGMKSDTVSFHGCNYLDRTMVESKWKHFKLDLEDIVISTSASMDKVAVVDKSTVGAIPYTGLIRFKMFECLNKKYFKYFIQSEFYKKQIDAQKSGGTIKHYGPTHLKKMIIPIPPIEEQQRIVEKLDEIIPIIEGLEKIMDKEK